MAIRVDTGRERYTVEVHEPKVNPSLEPDPVVVFPYSLGTVTSFDHCEFQEVRYDDSPGGEIIVEM
jgi:hypothetical protein